MFSNWPGYAISRDITHNQPVYACQFAAGVARPVVVPPMGSPVLGFRGVPQLAVPRYAQVARAPYYAAAPAAPPSECAAAVAWLRDFVEGERRVLHDRIRALESGGAPKFPTSAANLRRELETVRTDFAASVAMEEEHRDKMDGYLKTLMKEMDKQQGELCSLTEKYANVVRELEGTRQRLKEVEKDKEREVQYNAIHATKLLAKEAEISALNGLVDRLRKTEEETGPVVQEEHETVDLGLMFKVNRLEAIVREQNVQLIAAERAKPNAANELSTEDVFACLRSQHTPTKNTNKVSGDQWLEPLELVGLHDASIN